MTDSLPGRQPPPGDDHLRQTADASSARQHRRTQRLLITTNDVELLTEIVRPALGLIATLRVAGHHDTRNVWLDDITGEGDRPQLLYRRVDDTLQPANITEAVDVAAITHLHLW
jgi:hypothetical protein